MSTTDNVDCASGLRRILQIIKLHNTKSRLLERCEIESYLQEIEVGSFKTPVELLLAGKCKKQLHKILKTYEEFECSLSNRYLSGDFSWENAEQRPVSISQSSSLNKRVGSSAENNIPLKKCCLTDKVVTFPSQSSQLSVLSPDLFSGFGLKSQAIGSNEFAVNASNNVVGTTVASSCNASRQIEHVNQLPQNKKSDLIQSMVISDSLTQCMQNIHISPNSNSNVQGKPPKHISPISSGFCEQTRNNSLLVSYADEKNSGNDINSSDLCVNFKNYPIDDIPIIFADESTEYNNYNESSHMECPPVLQLEGCDISKTQSTNTKYVKGLDTVDFSANSQPIGNSYRLNNCNLVDGDTTREQICSTINESVVHIKTLYAHIKEGLVNATRNFDELRPLREGFIDEMLEYERLNSDKKLHLLTMLFERKISD